MAYEGGGRGGFGGDRGGRGGGFGGDRGKKFFFFFFFSVHNFFTNVKFLFSL